MTPFVRRLAPLRPVSLLLVGLIGLGLLAGCASPERDRQKIIESLGPPQPLLHGRSEAFGGRLLIDATLSAVPPAVSVLDAPGAMEDSPFARPGAPARHSLGLSFRNQSKSDIAITVVDVTSPLGAFSPRPPRLLLAPGQESPLQGMPSAYAANFETLDVTVKVAFSGREETQTVSLRKTDRVPPPPEPPARLRPL